MNVATLLDIPFDSITQTQVLALIKQRLEEQKTTRIVTINPEFLLEAERNSEFKEVLKSADLHLADGIGILWATHFLAIKPLFPKLYRAFPKLYSLYQCFYTLVLLPFTKKVTHNPLPERVTGSDLFIPLAQQLAATNQRIFLLGGAEGVAEKTAQILQSQINNIEIAGYYSGSPKKDDAQKIIAIINDSKATALFVAFQFPAQDIWIAHYLPRLHQVKMAIGVGGTFDFITGSSHIAHGNTNTKRAPHWMRKLNLEWLWRLITQPYRWKRIFNATVKFIKRVYRAKLSQLISNPIDSYRGNEL